MWLQMQIGSVLVILVACHKVALANPRSSRLASSTSATISVQRFAGSTFYNYVKSEPTTQASFQRAEQQTDIESGTEVPTFIPEVVYSSSSSSSDSDSSDSSGDSVESEEDLVSSGNEDDVATSQSYSRPTVIPIVLVTGESEAVTNQPAAAVAADDGVESAVSPSSPNDNAEQLPADQDQTPPPAEAVPGQPGEDEGDSSSSSSSSEDSSSSSSSSEEDFRQEPAYNTKKLWQFSKLKIGRLSGKLAKKEQQNSKYTY